MALAETFEFYRNQPEWDEFSFQEKEKLRRNWIALRARAAGKSRDPAFLTVLEKEAYADAPWGMTQKAPFAARQPELTGAYETGIRLLRAPQQYVANYLAQMGEKVTPGEAFLGPIRKTGEYLKGEREATELPGGMTTETLTDPLSYIGWGLGAKAIPALRKVKAGKEMLEAVKAPGVAKELGEVIPRTFGEFSPFQQEVYKKTMQAGRRFFAPDELKQVAATLANLPEREAATALNRLGKMKNANEARSLLAWAQSPMGKRAPRWWKSKPPTGAAAVTPEAAGGAATSTPEAINKLSPKDFLNQLMSEPTLEY